MMEVTSCHGRCGGGGGGGGTRLERERERERECVFDVSQRRCCLFFFLCQQLVATTTSDLSFCECEWERTNLCMSCL